MVTFFPAYADESFTNISFKWHLGSAYIIANAREHGYRVSQFVAKQPLTLDEAIDGLCKQHPSIIGVTCYDVNYYFAAMICRQIRQRRPDIVIVAGGPSATFSDQFILGRDNGIDICVRGDGELASLELIDAVRDSTDFGSIPGISFRRGETVVRNADRDLLTSGVRGRELDDLPSPYLTGALPVSENLGLLTSRGCVYHCTYCNFSSMSRWQVRYHSVDRVVAELGAISELTTPDQVVPIQDDTFTLDLNRIEFAGSHDPVGAALLSGPVPARDVYVEGAAVVSEYAHRSIDEGSLAEAHNAAARALVEN